MYSILLIDDELDITLTIKGILEDTGFKVDSFNDPLLVFNNYKANFYDLIILDILMPKMNGFELYVKIREKDPTVKVCFLTASEFYYEKFRKKIFLNWLKYLIKSFLFKNQSKMKI
jgi:DNA-binding response OmpR family regulator